MGRAALLGALPPPLPAAIHKLGLACSVKSGQAVPQEGEQTLALPLVRHTIGGGNRHGGHVGGGPINKPDVGMLMQHSKSLFWQCLWQQSADMLLHGLWSS